MSISRPARRPHTSPRRSSTQRQVITSVHFTFQPDTRRLLCQKSNFVATSCQSGKKKKQSQKAGSRHSNTNKPWSVKRKLCLKRFEPNSACLVCTDLVEIYICCILSKLCGCVCRYSSDTSPLRAVSILPPVPRGCGLHRTPPGLVHATVSFIFNSHSTAPQPNQPLVVTFVFGKAQFRLVKVKKRDV